MCTCFPTINDLLFLTISVGVLAQLKYSNIQALDLSIYYQTEQ